MRVSNFEKRVYERWCTEHRTLLYVHSGYVKKRKKRDRKEKIRNEKRKKKKVEYRQTTVCKQKKNKHGRVAI